MWDLVIGNVAAICKQGSLPRTAYAVPDPTTRSHGQLLTGVTARSRAVVCHVDHDAVGKWQVHSFPFVSIVSFIILQTSTNPQILYSAQSSSPRSRVPSKPRTTAALCCRFTWAKSSTAMMVRS